LRVVRDPSCQAEDSWIQSNVGSAHLAIGAVDRLSDQSPYLHGHRKKSRTDQWRHALICSHQSMLSNPPKDKFARKTIWEQINSGIVLFTCGCVEHLVSFNQGCHCNFGREGCGRKQLFRFPASFPFHTIFLVPNEPIPIFGIYRGINCRFLGISIVSAPFAAFILSSKDPSLID